MTNPNGKTVLFTGAGAVIPWGAPTSAWITKLIREDRIFLSIDGEPLGEWIYKKLTSHYKKDPETVNFETILNVLEYLITYYSSRDLESIAAYKNIMPAFFDEKRDFDTILSFDRIYKKENYSWYSDPVPGVFFSSWRDNRAFFGSVFRRFIDIVIDEVERYSKSVEVATELNGLLNEFLLAEESILRCYTTNYDRLVPSVFNGEMFEGFSEKDGELKFDGAAVLCDAMGNVYYNLHGSAHYEMDFPDNVKLNKTDFIRGFGSGSGSKADQDSRIIYHSNIISGFNKVGRILANPYSQFYHRFCQDCLEADRLYIVGYSFGDLHLNMAMRGAMSVNKKLRLTAIDYILMPGEKLDVSEYDWIDFKDKSSRHIVGDYKIREVTTVGDVGRVRLYRKGFERFLRLREWKKRF